MAELTPLPIYQNAPLDEISGYQVGTKIGIFDPDPLPDHQIGVLRRHLEKFPPAAPRAAPAGQGRCLPAPTPAAGERANSSTVHAPPRPLALGLGNLKPAAPGQPKKSKQKPKAITRAPELLSLCGAPELARGIGRREQVRDDLVRSIASSEQNADVPRGVRLLLARSPSLRCSHEGVR